MAAPSDKWRWTRVRNKVPGYRLCIDSVWLWNLSWRYWKQNVPSCTAEGFLWHNFMLIKSVKVSQSDGGIDEMEVVEVQGELHNRGKSSLWINAFLNASLDLGSKHVCFSYLLHSYNIETIGFIQFLILGHSDNFWSRYEVAGLRPNTVPVSQQQWHTVMLGEEPVQSVRGTCTRLELSHITVKWGRRPGTELCEGDLRLEWKEEEGEEQGEEEAGEECKCVPVTTGWRVTWWPTGADVIHRSRGGKQTQRVYVVGRFAFPSNNQPASCSWTYYKPTCCRWVTLQWVKFLFCSHSQ